MINLGNTYINGYRVWIAESSTAPMINPNDNIKQVEDSYYDLLLSKEESSALHYYINLIKDEKFKWLFDLDEQDRHTQQSDAVQYKSYQDRKGMSQPMWKLSASSVNRLLSSLSSK